MESRYVVPMHGDATPSNSTDGNVLPADDQIAYKVPHAARVLDIGVRTAWQLVKSGEIESFTVGRSRRITRAALVAWVNSHKHQAAA
jgi:excisionase family DNA binding protein